MPVVEAIDLRKRFGATSVLDGVSFTLDRGEGLCLFGPSGCGKTTLLRIVAGLERPDAGTVRLHDGIATGQGVFVPPERRDIGMVFQDLALWPHMRVGRHLDFVLRARQMSRDDRMRRARELLTLCELSDRYRGYPAQLSGGEQQRLGIARALATEPRVLLLDEPYSNLNAEMRDRISHEIGRRMREDGVAVLLATHRPVDARGLSTRILHMDEQGYRIEEVGEDRPLKP